jgi:hypothetical protein
MTFIHIIFGNAQSIGNILERTGFTEITDRKNGAENSFQADVLPGGCGELRLQETLIGVLLDVDELGISIIRLISAKCFLRSWLFAIE